MHYGRRNRGQYARSMAIVDYIYRVKKTTVPEIARELHMSERQVRRDIQDVGHYFCIDIKPGRGGGISWKEGVYTDLDDSRKALEEDLMPCIGADSVAQFIRIIQCLDYLSQIDFYKLMSRLFAYWRKSLGGGLVLLAVMGFIPGTALTVRAAGTEPTVSNLCIVDAGSGISAQCDYDGYVSGSDYDIQLYLDQWNGDTRSTVELTILDKNGTDTGRTNTSAVGSGIYSATAVVRDNVTPGATARYYETGKYRVIKTDSGYEITKWQSSDGYKEKRVQKELEKELQEEPQNAGCEHVFEEVQINEADSDHDAVVAMQCRFCGKAKDYREIPNSAYAYFQNDSVQKILNASMNGEVVISTARWISFHHMVTDAMEERPDVKVTVVYRYKGVDDTIVVPADANRGKLANEDGYCGFLYLRHIYMEDKVF